jgi:uncharacterized protein YrrD
MKPPACLEGASKMRKAKELIGRSIVHQATGERLATVNDVIFDSEARRVCALLTTSGGWFNDAQVVPWSRVAAVGDVILVQGDPPIITTADAPEIAEQVKGDGRISGTAIVSDTGERLGVAGDLFIDQTGNVTGIEVRQGFMSFAGKSYLPAEQVQAVGRDAIIATVVHAPASGDAQQAER